MEWVDDVQLFMCKGAASPVAYHMAAPLLADITTSLQVCRLCDSLPHQVIKALNAIDSCCWPSVRCRSAPDLYAWLHAALAISGAASQGCSIPSEEAERLGRSFSLVLKGGQQYGQPNCAIPTAQGHVMSPVMSHKTCSLHCRVCQHLLKQSCSCLS